MTIIIPPRVDIPRKETIPAGEMREKSWTNWSYAVRDGKLTKPPMLPSEWQRRPDTWLSFGEAMARCQANPGKVGIGYILTKTEPADIIGIDLDKCILNNGELTEVGRDLIALGTYTEVSPSGRGLRAFIRGAISENRKVDGREIYDGREHSARYLTVTGDRYPGAGRKIREGPEAQEALGRFYSKWFPPKAERARPDMLSDEQILGSLRSAANSEKFERLWRGDSSGYKSQSNADLGLCRMLKFYTQDARQIDRLFRQSGLFRPKWDSVHGGRTYGERTIGTALASSSSVYEPHALRDEGWKWRARGMVALWWSTKVKGCGELSWRVLIYLAGHANENGECFPSVPTMAKDLGASESAISEAISKLVAKGVLWRRKRHQTSNLYVLRYALTPGQSLYC